VETLTYCVNLEQITVRESFTQSVEDLCTHSPYLKIVIDE
jgi:hypothetical protein